MNSSIVKTYAVVLVFTLLALFAVKEFNIAYPIEVSSVNKSGELAVVGEGKVDVVPDTAFADVGITVADAKTVSEAENQINKTNIAIVDALKKIGIAINDIKTSNYSINPNYSYDAGSSGKITGYSGNVTVSIKVRQSENLPNVIEQSTKAGANQVISTRYEIDSPEKYREEARSKAISNAKDQAQKLAKTLGITLGKIVNIVESSPNIPMPQMNARSEMGMGGGGQSAPQLEPGSQTVSSTVTLYFEKR